MVGFITVQNKTNRNQQHQNNNKNDNNTKKKDHKKKTQNRGGEKGALSAEWVTVGPEAAVFTAWPPPCTLR
eukprot:NODE_10253_length_292_cov_6.456790_g8485_i0.p2 GENE.NODE_10253_length_292_cov_6.456790_g8485_i0~~NODE_10253_length_292_cov_6.456790_g8485_i0.p2  ORF type:complete len:71 (-),score=14.27 NODE_10253_length_292_cov_6.456790_g8485_i0:16-228(-)